MVWREWWINYANSSRSKKIYATLNGRGCDEILFEHLGQLASPNLDSDSQELVFDRSMGQYYYAVAKWPAGHLVKVFYTLAVSYLEFFSNSRNQRNPLNSNYQMLIKNCQAIQKC